MAGPDRAVFIPFGFPASPGVPPRLAWILNAQEGFCGMTLYCNIHSAWEMPRRFWPHAPLDLDPFMPRLPCLGIELLAHASAIARATSPDEHDRLLPECLGPARAYTHVWHAMYSRGICSAAPGRAGWPGLAARAIRTLRAALHAALGKDLQDAVDTLRAISGLPDHGDSRRAGVVEFWKPVPGGHLSSRLQTSEDQFLVFCDFRFFGRVIALSCSRTCHEADALVSRSDEIYSEHLDPNADCWQWHNAWSTAQILVARWAGRMVRLMERDRFGMVLE